MKSTQHEKAIDHFNKRSTNYNVSSNWVHDEKLLSLMYEMAEVKGDEVVLDLASGTGLVSKFFHGKVKELIGLDICHKMTGQAEGLMSRLVAAPVEKIPLEENSIDLSICRQGLQFVDLEAGLPEIYRVMKKGGRAVFCHLAAYGEEDKTEAFKIQSLRNPARKNYFLPGDLESKMEKAGFRIDDVVKYQTKESVAKWINHDAISAEYKKKIFEAYRNSSDGFKKIHNLEILEEDVMDTMLMVAIKASK